LGHVAGDKVLQKVAQCLKTTFREKDFIARYGGDEFVAMIERLTEEMAREKILAFKKTLAKRRFVSHKSGQVHVNVSAGIAVSTSGDTPESLIERADRAMYDAKHRRPVSSDQSKRSF
jgi:diguanylate cyclase (GGDEF)-like protein